ncbi:MAG: hypothetical protein ACP5C4_06000 [Methanomicrobiales archaeon]
MREIRWSTWIAFSTTWRPMTSPARNRSTYCPNSDRIESIRSASTSDRYRSAASSSPSSSIHQPRYSSLPAMMEKRRCASTSSSSA